MSGSLTLRTIEPAEREAVLDLLAGWLDRAFFARYFAHDPTFRDDLCFIASDRGRFVSTLQVFRKTVCVAGAALSVGAVGNVYTDPAYRGSGTASALIERAVSAMRAQGFAVSLLFASRVDFYARFGWRSHLRYLSFIEPGQPEAAGPAGAAFDPARDLDQVMEVYTAHSGAVPGATLRDRSYWSGQLAYAGNPDERFRVVRARGRVVAYARAAALYGFNSVIEHGCLPGTEPALADLILGLHAGAATGTLAQLVPSAELEALLRERGLRIQSVEDRSWMWRVIDPEQLAAALRIPVADVHPDLFDEVLPAARSRYWLADRF